jgi:hypothetical protein
MESSHKKNPSISLSNPLVVSEMLKTTVNYIIKSEHGEEIHESTRTYEEFIHLRKLLAQKWPGTFLPAIPSKSFLSNLNTKYIKTYKRQLEEFFSYTQTIPHLFESEEFQCFLKSKSPFTLKPKSDHSEVSLNHQAIFHEYIGRALNPESLSSLKDHETQLQLSLQSIIDMRDKAEVLSEDFKKFHSSFASAFNSLEKNEKLLVTSEDSEDLFFYPDLPNVKNNFFEFSSWAENEILQIEAMLEAVEFVWKLQKMQDDIESFLLNCRAELEKIDNNRVSFTKLLSFKTKEKFIRDKNFDIANKENEKMNLRNFQTIVALRLNDLEIPRFKEDRLAGFGVMKEKFNEIVKKSVETFTFAANKTLANVSRSRLNST